MRNKSYRNFWGAVLAGFLGGFLAMLVLKSTPAVMAHSQMNKMAASIYNLVDENGKIFGRMEKSKNFPPMFYLFDENGKMRIQMATYEDGVPLFALNDHKNRTRGLYRLAGKNHSPVIVMKDSKGKDRIVMGLDLTNEKENPFLAYFDEKGKKHMAFGNY